jgi:dihydroorotate dehydrogenase (NAD+) catalytic subunit
MSTQVDTTVRIGSLTLRNPVLTASGTFGYGPEFSEFVDFSKIGGLVTKGISLLPRPGNPPPRIMETPCGMLNAIGLQNVGLEAFLRDKLPWLAAVDCAVLVNVYGGSPEDYQALARRLDGAEGVDGLEVNVSCPNVAAGGALFGKDPGLLGHLVGLVRAAYRGPLVVKLTPDVTDLAAMARVCQEQGADAVSLVNTFRGMAVDLERRRPLLHNVFGGLSGPAIKPLALARVLEVSRAVSIPVIGMGGIMDAHDALEFLLVGASAVQVGTANFVDPGAAVRVAQGVEHWLGQRGCTSLKDFVGTLQEW